MAVDVNNLPTAEEFIQRYNLWDLVDYVHSGFVTYPVYAMNLDELRKWDEKWVEELSNTEFNPAENNHTIWDNIKW
jgi:3-methyladenine DNA glycosylase AlkD